MPPPGKGDPWLPFRKPRAVTGGARVRLFCLPYAGGGASLYRTWQDELPLHVEVCPVQLPGRESRLRDAPVPEMMRLVPMLADALLAGGHLAQPFALFGHSMGAAISFELQRELRRRGGPRPVHFFASACPPPHVKDTDATHDLPEAELIARMRSIGGMSEEILQNRELMEMILPVFRADAAVTETYEHTEEAPLEVPLTAFAGLEDEKALPPVMEQWRQHSRGAFALQTFPGGHFFLQSARAALLRAVAKALP